MLEFEIYNQTDLPGTTPGGTDVEEVSIYSEVRAPIEPFMGVLIEDEIEVTASVTTDLPHRSPFED